MKQVSEQMDELMAKKLCGEASKEEEMVLQEWMDRDPANAEQYTAMTRNWQTVDALLAENSFDTEAAWSKVAAQTIEKDAAKQARIIPLLQRVASVAAILLVAVVVYWMVAGELRVEMLADSGNKELALPDGTQVTLHAGSRLSYNKTLAGKERRVTLEGEAYFKVHRDEQHPFVIEAQAGEVQVLGTAFDLKCSEVAAIVTVVEGKVRFSSASDRNNFVILTKNQKARLANNEIRRSLVEDENFLYWKTGVLVFDNRNMVQIAEQLSEIFDKKIVLGEDISEAQKRQVINTSFKGSSLEQILSEICIVSGFRWIKQADGLYKITGR
ncbi:MAG: FecR domain-containing protein [Taibaiella sp.]|nr:FecR domain-containing protein [Taibaiella sp.]